MLALVMAYMIGVVLLGLWNIACAVRMLRGPERPPIAMRCAAAVAALAGPVGAVCLVAGMSPWDAPLFALAPLLPVALAAGAAVSIAIRRCRTLGPLDVARAVGNGWFALTYALVIVSYHGIGIGGLELVKTAYAMAVSFMAFPLAIFFPIAYFLPAMPWPGSSPGTALRATGGLLAAMPLAVAIGSLLLTPVACRLLPDSEAPTVAAALPEDFACGVVMRVKPDHLHRSPTFADELAELAALDVGAVNLFVNDDVAEDPDLGAGLQDLCEQLRARGVRVIVTTDYPADQWVRQPPLDLAEVEATLAPLQDFVATQLRPDILVPYVEPYGAFPAITGIHHTPQDWAAVLRSTTERIHALAPEVRCAVYFCDSDEDLELYRLVALANHPIDIVGVSFYSVFQTTGEFRPTLERRAEMMHEVGSPKEHWVFEFGQCPVTLGGELGQAQFIAHGLQWAARNGYKGACVFSLRDYDERMGLIASTGRDRAAYRTVEEASRPMLGTSAASAHRD